MLDTVRYLFELDRAGAAPEDAPETLDGGEPAAPAEANPRPETDEDPT